jgi:hypothetical protein
MCDRCNGKGFITSTELVEHFGGGYRMPVFYTCDCLADGRCPKCDNELTDDDKDGNIIIGKAYCSNCDSWWEVA